MTPEQKRFLYLAIVKQHLYAEISLEMGLCRKQFSLWWKELKNEREELSMIRKKWKQKFQFLSFDNFEKWYRNNEKKCWYCGITEDQIKKLIEQEKINTKRLKTRGKHLEVDRLFPNKAYDDLDNLVFCCYWCNNAKTDEFSENEFKPIGKEISKIWKKRLLKKLNYTTI